MKVIQQNCDKHANIEQAQDALFGLSHITGFVVGYIDEQENRPVAFFVDAFPDSPLSRGQRRRELVFAARKDEAKESSGPSLAGVVDCIQNGTDNLGKR